MTFEFIELKLVEHYSKSKIKKPLLAIRGENEHRATKKRKFEPTFIFYFCSTYLLEEMYSMSLVF